MILKSFGPVIQNGFVVSDLSKAIAAWTRLGVGPFFTISDSSYATTRFRGKTGTAQFAIALANWNGIQIELIQQMCDTPSVYKEFLDEGRVGLHHMLTTTPDIEAILPQLEEDGHELLADVDIGENGRVIYFRMADQKWPLIEVGEFTSAIEEIFEMIRRESDDWDGSDPVRALG